MVNLKEVVCDVGRFAPKVRIGPFEWNVPELMAELLHCGDNELKAVCYVDINGKRVCEVTQQREHDKASQILRETF